MVRTRDEDARDAVREEQDCERRLEWARDWFLMDAYCPHCRSEDISILSANRDDNYRTEIWRCGLESCGGRWKVELLESQIAFMSDADDDGDWLSKQDALKAQPKEVEKAINTNGVQWSDEDTKAARAEGWTLQPLINGGHQIGSSDRTFRFEDDAKATVHVVYRAAAGSLLDLKALALAAGMPPQAFQ